MFSWSLSSLHFSRAREKHTYVTSPQLSQNIYSGGIIIFLRDPYSFNVHSDHHHQFNWTPSLLIATIHTFIYVTAKERGGASTLSKSVYKWETRCEGSTTCRVNIRHMSISCYHFLQHTLLCISLGHKLDDPPLTSFLTLLYISIQDQTLLLITYIFIHLIHNSYHYYSCYYVLIKFLHSLYHIIHKLNLY